MVCVILVENYNNTNIKQMFRFFQPLNKNEFNCPLKIISTFFKTFFFVIKNLFPYLTSVSHCKRFPFKSYLVDTTGIKGNLSGKSSVRQLPPLQPGAGLQKHGEADIVLFTVSFTFTFNSYAGYCGALSPPYSKGRAIVRKAYRLLCRILRIMGMKSRT